MNRQLLLFLTACAVSFSACDSAENAPPSLAPSGLVDLGDRPGAALSTVANVVTLNGYTVEFLGAEPVADVAEATEFRYLVTRVDSSSPSSNYFFLENACGAAPVAFAPTGAVTQGVNADTGIYGIQWNPSTADSQEFSYTFTNAQLGVVRTVIRAGAAAQVATLPGPCGGLATLSGSVFVNTDADTDRSDTELGIGNVQVEVYDGAEIAASSMSALDGSFSFTLLRSEYTATGTYTVRIPTEDGVFNAALYGSYDYAGATESAELPVVLDGDVNGVDFGFNPDKQKIITELSEGGQYQTSAQDVRFWKSAVRNAGRGRSTANPYGGEALSPAAIRSYLDAIFDDASEDPFYLLSDPFVLVGTDPLAYAADLLSRPIRTDVEIVTQNLFAMQLNLMQGWGTGDRNYDDTLMSYLEEWVRANSGGARASALNLDGKIFKAGGGGGGTIEEVTITKTYLGGGGGGTIE